MVTSLTRCLGHYQSVQLLSFPHPGLKAEKREGEALLYDGIKMEFPETYIPTL